MGIPAACYAGQSRGVWSQGGLQFFGGRGSNFFRGVVSNFSGGSPIFRGGKWGPPIFCGGEFFFISAFFGDTPPPPQKQSQAYGQRAAGAHPTGMHSCYDLLLQDGGSWPPCQPPPPHPLLPR